MKIYLDQIEVGDGRRTVNPEKVKEIADSIKEICLVWQPYADGILRLKLR